MILPILLWALGGVGNFPTGPSNPFPATRSCTTYTFSSLSGRKAITMDLLNYMDEKTQTHTHTHDGIIRTVVMFFVKKHFAVQNMDSVFFFSFVWCADVLVLPLMWCVVENVKFKNKSAITLWHQQRIVEWGRIGESLKWFNCKIMLWVLILKL